MINRFNKVLAVATISLVSANVSAGHKANSYYPLKSKSHSYSSPFNFLAWGLFSRLESIQSGVDANTLAIEDNKSAIATLEDSLTEPVIAIGSVTLDVDCNENGSALAEAYAANTTATQLRLNIVGECYGDFQSVSSLMPDLHISAIDPAVPASIIPNPDSALVGLVATNTNVSFTNINIVAGDNDFHVVNANSNASVTLENVTLDAVAGNDYMIRVGTSSEGLLNNVTVNGNEQLRRGVLVTKGSYLDVSNSTISGTLEQSAALLASGTLRVSGTSDFSSRITSSQSVVSLGTGSNITTRGVSLTAGSSMHMSTDSVLVSNGRIGVAEGSQFKARDVVINDDDLYVERGSSFRSRDTGASLVINNGRLRVRYGSNAQISEGQITSEPGSYALDVTNKSIVTMDSTVDESPFLFDGRATVENSSLETEEAIFLNTLELEFGATAILGSGSELLSGFDEQTGSAVYFD